MDDLDDLDGMDGMDGMNGIDVIDDYEKSSDDEEEQLCLTKKDMAMIVKAKTQNEKRTPRIEAGSMRFSDVIKPGFATDRKHHKCEPMQESEEKEAQSDNEEMSNAAKDVVPDLIDDCFALAPDATGTPSKLGHLNPSAATEIHDDCTQMSSTSSKIIQEVQDRVRKSLNKAQSWNQRSSLFDS